MAKTNNTKISPKTIGRFLTAIVVAVVFSFGFVQAKNFLFTSPIFTVRQIEFQEPSIQFVRVRELAAAVGKNIFQVNLDKIALALRRQYPQITQVRVIRKFPDRLSVGAKKIHFALQLEYKSKYYVLDQDGIVLFDDPKPRPGLLVVKGLKIAPGALAAGSQVNAPELNLVENIQKIFQSKEKLSRFPLAATDVTNLAKIELLLQTGLKVIIDNENGAKAIDTLGFLLAQKKVDWNQISYVDLRFKEPVVQQKEPIRKLGYQ